MRSTRLASYDAQLQRFFGRACKGGPGNPGFAASRIVGPGPEHLEILEALCRESGATGRLVTDAHHAAIAVEHGWTMVSTDSDFSRFPGLRWQHPLRPGSF